MGISNNADLVILSPHSGINFAKNLLFIGSKKQILQPAASE
jgi:hypothetical protein